MTSSRRFYVVGPPTPSRADIPVLLRDVLFKTNVIPTAHMEVTSVEGSIPFHSAWTSGGRQHTLRPGMNALELWAGIVSWQATDDVQSLSVIVEDYKYIVENRGTRQRPPRFETFVVSLLRDDQPGVASIHIWDVMEPPQEWWRNRGTWLTESNDDSAPRQRALERLRGPPWQAMQDLEVLLTPRGSVRPSRRERRTSKPDHQPGKCYEVQYAPRRDEYVPDGLEKFLASVCRRPSSFDQLCRTLWEFHIGGATHTSFEVWYRDTW